MLVGFDSWQDVLSFARAGGRFFYKAPMDYRPRMVRVVKVYKNGGIRLDPMSSSADNFTADADHLDRMLRDDGREDLSRKHRAF